jgi:hypothetical protein
MKSRTNQSHRAWHLQESDAGITRIKVFMQSSLTAGRYDLRNRAPAPKASRDQGNPPSQPGGFFLQSIFTPSLHDSRATASSAPSPRKPWEARLVRTDAAIVAAEESAVSQAVL